MSTVRELLAGCGDVDPADAQILLAESLQKNRAWLIAHAEDPVPERDRNRFLDWINRRRGGEPIAYLTGWREFWSLRLRITPDTLIPRPETELLVEKALERIPETGPCTILDLGTGSGAIALAIGCERPEARVIGVDCSLPAVILARENARRLNIGNVDFHHGDWFEPVDGQWFDRVVSNPPYVAEDDAHLKQGDCAWEPKRALTPGGDGLAAYRTILEGLDGHLVPGGAVLFEHGHDQREALTELLAEAGLESIESWSDLAGIPRIVAGQRPLGDD